MTLRNSHVPPLNTKYSLVIFPHKYYLNTVTRSVNKHSHSPVILSYKYYFNSVTGTVSKHTATFLPFYHIHITLTQSHVPSVNTQLQSCQFYHIKINFTQSHVPSVNTQLYSCHVFILILL